VKVVSVFEVFRICFNSCWIGRTMW